MRKAFSAHEINYRCFDASNITQKSFIYIAGLIVFLSFPAGALQYDREAVSFATVEELLSSGKELKVWSDTSVRIMGVSFTHHDNGISWRYTANRSVPCTLSVGDTLDLNLYATYIRKADSSAVDSLALATGPGQFNYTSLNVAAFPHSLATSNTIIGPSSDTAGKTLRFSRDSVSCTLRHKVSYSFVWDDGFRSPWTDARTATHCWSDARQYGVRVFARCQEYLYADTVQAFPVVIAPVMLNVAPGAYKSGLFARAVGGIASYPIDFSEITAESSRDSDIVFNSNGGYSFTAPRGIISLGIYDSLPALSEGGCGRAVPDTSAVCRAQKQTLDSIVGALSIICPSVMPDTVMRMNVGQFCLTRTTEDYYAILVKVGEYIGGIDWEYYYWGYQSDGACRLYPGVASGTDNEFQYREKSGIAGIRLIKQGNKLRLEPLGGRSVREIAIYKCNGSLIYHYSFKGTKAAAAESGRLSKGVYIISVRTDKDVLKRLVYMY